MSPAKSSATRGDETREALLAAAIEVFGRDGFHAASTRAIASAAGVNQALIGYHFNGKHGLYLAAFKFIAAQVGEHMRPVIESVELRISAVEPGAADATAVAVGAMETLFSAALNLFLQDSSAHWVRLIMRSQLDPDEGIEILYEGIFGSMLKVLTRLVALAKNGDVASEPIRLQALMLLGQMLIFLVARGSVFAQMGWREIEVEHRQSIEQQLHLQLRAIFDLESMQ
jgi:AcrR family transcriptional regulator